MNAPWYKAGLRFECTACGTCCRDHGDYAYVYLSTVDIEAIGAHLGLSRRALFERYCGRTHGYVHLSNKSADCLFLDSSGCRIYPVRPKQCATWPFWSENLAAEIWNGPVKACCPGIGQGKLYTAQEIEASARERDEWHRED